MQLTKLALAAALVAGCSGETGILFAVDGAGLAPAKLEFHLAELDGCGRWTQHVGKVAVDVRGRDLRASPYRLLIGPGAGGAAATVAVDVVALDGDGKAIGEASLGGLAFKAGAVVEVGRPLAAIAPQAWDDPDGACLCREGMPWMASASGGACDGEVPANAQAATATDCAAPPAWACDGVAGADERAPRALPCFAEVAGGNGSLCKVAVRDCLDDGAIGYAQPCTVDDNSPTLPTPANAGQLGSLCDQWNACAQDPCVDPIACLTAKAPAQEQTLPGVVEGGLFKPCVAGMPVKLPGVAALLTGNDAPPVAANAVWLAEASSGRRGLVATGTFEVQVDPFPWPAPGGDTGTIALGLAGALHTVYVVKVKFLPLQSCLAQSAGPDGGMTVSDGG